ncbi:MAG: xanthine dehydrogenase family protein molybdopterin-binding subunit [Sulfolobaceae archaeon]
MKYIGKPIKRIIEDPVLIKGKGNYVNDISLPGMLYAVFIRSKYAHAKFKISNCPSGCYTAKDFSVEIGLAKDEVTYFGEPIAVVVADDEYKARDLAEQVEVEYEPLEPVLDPERAMDKNSPKVRSDLQTNIFKESKIEYGDVESAFARAYKIISGTLVNQRVIPLAMEPRGAIAHFDGKRLTIWSSTQDAFSLKKEIEEVIASHFSIGEVRVIQPFVGGAFGSKIIIYPEEFVIAYLAVMLNRPVKFFNTRTEDMISTNHGRDMKFKYKVAVDSYGRILGIDGVIIHDLGAPNPAINEDSFWMSDIAGRLIVSHYNIPNVRINVYGVNTNKTFIGAYRGAGRPEAAYFSERLMDIIARSLGIDRWQIRERNTLDRVYNYTTPTGIYIDSGEYKEFMNRVKSVYEELKQYRDELRKKGRLVGLGIAFPIEIASFGPYGTAKVRVNPNGKLVVITGGGPQGQGDATAFAQVTAEVFDISPENIEVLWGDTELISQGYLTAGSRTLTVGGSAVYDASVKLLEKLKRIASEKFGVSLDEVEYREGKFINRRNGDTMDLGKVAREALRMGIMPEESSVYVMKDYTTPYGIHLALVEVDRETGFVKILEYKAFDDVGVVVNPLLAEGQVHGGIAQGIGQALLEEAVYDENGILVNSNLADYAILTSYEMPKVSWTPISLARSATPLGSKGIGELPTIISTPTIVSAIEDAIGEVINLMPVKPELILKLLNK